MILWCSVRTLFSFILCGWWVNEDLLLLEYDNVDLCLLHHHGSGDNEPLLFWLFKLCLASWQSHFATSHFTVVTLIRPCHDDLFLLPIRRQSFRFKTVTRILKVNQFHTTWVLLHVIFLLFPPTVVNWFLYLFMLFSLSICMRLAPRTNVEGNL